MRSASSAGVARSGGSLANGVFPPSSKQNPRFQRGLLGSGDVSPRPTTASSRRRTKVVKYSFTLALAAGSDDWR